MRPLPDVELEIIRERAMALFLAYAEDHPGVMTFMLMGMNAPMAHANSVDKMSYFGGINDAFAWLLGNDVPTLDNLAGLKCTCDGSRHGAAPGGGSVVDHLNACLKQSQS